MVDYSPPSLESDNLPPNNDLERKPEKGLKKLVSRLFALPLIPRVLLLLIIFGSLALTLYLSLARNPQIAFLGLFEPTPPPITAPVTAPLTPTPTAIASPIPYPTPVSCSLNLSRFTVSNPCYLNGTPGYQQFDYECVNGGRGTLYNAACTDITNAHNQLLNECRSHCTSPSPTPPPTSDPSAQAITCRLLVHRSQNDQGLLNTNDNLLSYYVGTINAGDYLGYEIELTNPNSYQVSSDVKVFTSNLNGVNEPTNLVGHSNSCTIKPDGINIDCSLSGIFIPPQTTIKLPGVALIQSVRSPLETGIYSTGIYFQGNYGNSQFNCDSATHYTITAPSPVPSPVASFSPKPVASASPLPSGCRYQQVQCFMAPCDPIVVCEVTPTPTPSPTPSPSPTSTIEKFGDVITSYICRISYLRRGFTWAETKNECISN